MYVNPWAIAGKFFKGNLHCHSTLSDGGLPLDEVVLRYRAQGYDFLAVTEHNLIADTRPFRDEHFTTLFGSEIHASVSAGGPDRYINAIGLPLDFAINRDLLLPEIARQARDAGAFVAMACPAFCGTTTQDVIDIDALHAVETYNETCAGLNDRALSWHLVDEAADRGKRLLGLAVDDAHFRDWPDWFGGWVEVKSETLTPESILAALKAGHYYSTQGPKIFDLRIEDSTLSITCSPVRSVILSGLESAGGFVHGIGITSATLPITAMASGYVRVTIVEQSGKRAWTNQLWLD